MNTTTAKFERDGLPTAVLDAREAAAYLAVAESTLRRMVRRGDLPHVRLGEVGVRFRLVDLDAWLAANRLYPLTSHTLTDPTQLRAEILRVRAQGYGLVVQELELGLCSLSVPIHDRTGKVVAALNVGMPFHEGIAVHAVKHVLPALMETRAAIEGATAHHWASLA